MCDATGRRLHRALDTQSTRKATGSTVSTSPEGNDTSKHEKGPPGLYGMSMAPHRDLTEIFPAQGPGKGDAISNAESAAAPCRIYHVSPCSLACLRPISDPDLTGRPLTS